MTNLNKYTPVKNYSNPYDKVKLGVSMTSCLL